MSEQLVELATAYHDIKKLLLVANDLSLHTTFDGQFRKTFLLSCSSYHEKLVTEMVSNFLTIYSNDSRVVNFAISKGVKRQYHKYFVWDNDGKVPNNINQFLSLFGKEFKDRLSQMIANDDTVKDGMRAFLIIGHLRNCVTHENIAAYTLSQTFEEIEQLNIQALKFLEFLETKFNNS